MGQRLALSVGINDYPGTGSDLRGCVNDANDVVAALTWRDFKAKTLIDAQATKANVVATLSEMLSSLKSGDEFVFHYSGHGTGIRDLNGDEADGRDEALVLYDFREGGLLIDDEIAVLMNLRKRGSHALTLSDSCFSGTLIEARSLSAPSDVRPKFLEPSVVGFDAYRSAYTSTQTRPVTGAALISGCDDGEYSYDASFNGRPNGAFTYVALNALRASQPRNLKAWHKAIRQTLPHERYPQTPQLSASLWERRRPMVLR